MRQHATNMPTAHKHIIVADLNVITAQHVCLAPGRQCLQLGDSRQCSQQTRRYKSAMLWNVIDNRTRPYRWREVNAIIEAVEHDNSCKDADQAPASDLSLTVDYDALEAVSVHEAVKWANDQRCPVTLYLYDLGDGFTDEAHFDEVANRFPDEGAGTTT